MVSSWFVVQSTWLERESVDGILKRAHFSGERERERSKKDFQERGEFKSGGEVCPGYLNSALRDLPMVVLTN